MEDAIAFCFPGQGAQYVGMGKTLLEGFPPAREVFEASEDLTGLPIRKIVLEGPMEELTRTEVLQVALTALEISLFFAARDAGLRPRAVAGHSLGEYPALFAAGVVDLKGCFRLVSARGSLMEEASRKRPGAMAAIIGLGYDELEALIGPLRDRGVIALANYNSPEQIIVTGERDPVAEAMKQAKARGARVVPLKVSGGYHSPLMDEAAEKFKEVLEDIDFSAPAFAYYSNVTGLCEKDPKAIKTILVEQIRRPVLWYPIVKNMVEDGIRVFVELGPKKVLTNLIKRSVSSMDVRQFQFEDLEGLKRVLDEIFE